LLHIRSLAGYTIDMLESSFWKRQWRLRREPEISRTKKTLVKIFFTGTVAFPGSDHEARREGRCLPLYRGYDA